MARQSQRRTAEPVRTSVKRKAKRALNATALRAEAQGHASKALEALVRLAEGATSESVRVSAANAVLDRAYGRPAAGGRLPAEDEEEGPGGPLEVRWLDAGR